MSVLLAPFHLLIAMATDFPSLGFIVFWLIVGAALFRLTAR